MTHARDKDTPRFVIGQVWAYRTRPEDEGSTLTVCRVERLKGQDVVHVFVDGIALRNPDMPDGVQDKLYHAPMTPEALAASVTERVGSVDALPDFREGYEVWKQAFEAGQAGLFDDPLDEVLAMIQAALDDAAHG